MSTPSEKLAASLEVLHGLQADGHRVFKSEEFTRVHRERLLRHGYLQQIIQGWLMSTRPGTIAGDTTPWHATFWEFCARYSSDRFGDDWHISPELSLLIHAEATAIPRQVVVYTPRGSNNTIELLFDTSLYDLMTGAMPPAEDIVRRDGLPLFTPSAALVRVPDSFFARHPVEAQVALGSVQDASDVLRPLLAGGHSVVAGRLAGAFRRIGRKDVADEVLRTMRVAGYDVREADPFAGEHASEAVRPRTPPMVARIRGLWNAMREAIIAAFPTPPGLPDSVTDYLGFVDDIYGSDAYHSLSIEGYGVTPDLVERVRSGDWNPEQAPNDREERDALAARGYWQAFQAVKRSVAAVLAGANPGELARAAHRDWYRGLFQPFVTAGVLAPPALAGYRTDPVYIKDSRHVPPRAQAVREAMPALFDLVEAEPEPSVRAVLGHWLVGYIHPYPDGNGRIARFLMNVMLSSGGYPWTVIRTEDRDAYLSALEAASVDSDMQPFARFLAERVRWSLDRMS
jgi:fido (protein-threonine AMPylation protein)